MDSSEDYENSPESSDCDRNPSPPPELTENPDLLLAESVGNTAFSKHWLFTTLIKLIEEVDKENDADSDLAVDVDEELQTELCKLWDMSMNSDVAKFLNEFKAIEILSGIIDKSKAPRVIEISVGILGNMACEKSVCKEMADNAKFIQLVLLLMETRDVPTLVESTRLIYTSLSDTSSRDIWINAIQRSEDFLNHLMFIFSSSTNCYLLKNSAELVDILLDHEPNLCVSWATDDFIHSLLEATDQIGSGHTEALEVYLHIFQSFSTSEPGVEALVSHIDRLEMKIIKYLNIVCEHEIVGLDGKEEPLASALSVLHISLTSRSNDKLEQLFSDEKIIRILLKILEPLYPMLQKYKAAAAEKNSTDKKRGKDINVSESDQNEGKVSEDSGSQDVDEETMELRQLEMLYGILSAFLLEYCSFAFNYLQEKTKVDNQPTVEQSSNKDEENKCEEKSNDSGDAAATNVTEVSTGDNTIKQDDSQSADKDNVRILTYLDEACSRWRINNLALTLKESAAGKTLLDQLLRLSKQFGKERLCRILTDVNSGRIVNRAESTRDFDENTT
ncbi:Protein saal1 [Mactra antiquata]